ncbi:RNB domain-containing ribonuclease [Streptomyces stelliscabiei]|uniref:RNB domain-containing ribonuclease n=1 Tax=Streptomyces stelliscabiei TaxID=146820 RepID=UPI0029B2E79F|nr:RNB domain-containing ribonuclease [Streptomyces stelliscabiei]MDX2551255.1 RNB domain-containing ribonuclease [Streptomyces stelliscabiei]MDX2615279.1 RNB domain-containing ribonuclease [Streptomyces stelliscabiei]MDX2633915.1 RNB domain-containing ribonuclease [Streptomyces stelliscabiei]MDX2664248.1 RNB domain-containing ribonuclease [Streptomyces stelliscabiei]MDX2711747.1 RNB domain-containing ribonuclease [Streptomyces stelliscabiei]
MPRRHLRVKGAAEAPLRAALRALRGELGVPDAFSLQVLVEAEQSAKSPRLPSYDATDLPLFTVDPPTSTDLDQAMHLSRRPAGGGHGGYRVRYAIADVAAFVTPGHAVDAEAHRRVTTLYFPDGKVPLHPARLSEGAASLLPGHTCPAVLWTLDLDADGRTESVDVRRALVRSRAKLNYGGVQQEIDAGTAEEPLALLKEIGHLRERLEVERGGISLNIPEQEITEHTAPGDGGESYELAYRTPLPAEGWNAQISLLTGMAAAELMLAAGTGVLRTLPAAPDGAVGRLRRTAQALHIDWPHHVSYARLVRSLDPHDPRHAAFLLECTTLLRGAHYTPFRDGRLPDITTHSAVAAPYAHCTAPLRRLVDRYASEICLAAAAGTPTPDWVLPAFDTLPAEMTEGTRRAGRVERECVDIVEAALLRDRVGEVFEGCVVDVEEDQPAVGVVQLENPAVIGRVTATPGGRLPLGERLRVRLTQAEPGAAKVRFVPA